MTLSLILGHRLPIVRQGLQQMLAQQPNIQILAEVADTPAAVLAMNRHSPKIALLDHDLPDLCANGSLAEIKKQQPGTAIILMSVPAKTALITRYLQMGVSGFLRTEFTTDELLDAIVLVAARQVYVCPKLTEEKNLKRSYPDRHLQSAALQRLTDRQREILRLLADGLSTKEIAHDLSISPKTVDSHRKDLMARLQIFSIAKLTKYALREGITTLTE